MQSKLTHALVLLTALMFMPLAPSQAAETADSQPTSMGQAIVGFHSGFLPPATPDALWSGLEVLKVEPRGDYLVVAADDLRDVRQATAGIPGIAYIEDDQVLHALAVPNDSRYGSQYGPAQMGAETAWGTVGYGSSSIVVAVLDTGIRKSHEDFESSRMLTGYDYVNNDSNPNDDCGHGTHVAGTVAATTNNAKGVAGMSQATIMPMKVLGPVGGLFSVTCSGSSSDINQAIYDATDDGAHIISMSLGGGGYSSAGNAAVNYAWSNGVLVVAAAGNDGASNSVDYPAAYANAIAVAALTSSKTKASYSDMGSQVEIAAPGSNVESTYNGNDADYDSLSGTSMATPHVAGALALALSCSPGTSASSLRSLMQSTAEDLGAAGRDTSYGFGLMRIDTLIGSLSCGGTPPVNSPPIAAMSHSESGLTTSVDGTGSSDPDGDPLTYAWNFGDGATGTGATASHTYASAGTYTVTLTVDDGKGGSDTASASVAVSTGGGGTPTDPDPATPNLDSGVSQSVSVSSGGEAHYKIWVPAGATELEVVMDGPSCGLTGCSFDADLYTRNGAKATDSTYDCRPYASGSDETCTHTSPASAWWYVRVKAYSGSGTVTLTATHDAPSSPPPANTPPVAAFSHSESLKTTSVDGSGSSDADGDALTYAWNFGDGATGTGATASHAYSAAGTYTVTLTVDDGNGGTDTATASVTVTNSAPTASFSSSTTGLTIDVDGTGSSDPEGDALSYAWNFGDGTTGSGATASHTYAAAGTYTVTLTVDDGDGGSDSATTSVTVTAPSDPDPATPNLASGVTQSVSVSSGGDTHYKIWVPAGTSALNVVMDGPSCGILGCSFDADLYVRQGAKATDSAYDCRPYASGSDESCAHTSPTSAWWYVRVKAYSGSGTVDLTATLS